MCWSTSAGWSAAWGLTFLYPIVLSVFIPRLCSPRQLSPAKTRHRQVAPPVQLTCHVAQPWPPPVVAHARADSARRVAVYERLTTTTVPITAGQRRDATKWVALESPVQLLVAAGPLRARVVPSAPTRLSAAPG